MNCKNAVLLEIFRVMVRAVDRCHIVRIIEQQRQRIECDRPGAGI